MVKKKPKSKAARQSASKDSLGPTPNDSSGNEPLASVLTPKVTNPVSAKVCRLCEARDGPFLNIFEADNLIARKIEDVMPFMIEESDDLPHKICFRCSAKLEELFEFLQKCIKTQESLRNAMGKTGPLVMKSKGKALWEEKVKKTNLSNDDICDALIKRAIEGIKDRPPSLPTPPEEELPPPKPPKKTKAPVKKDSTSESSDGEQDEITLKQVKLSVEKCDEKPSPRSLRTKKTETLVEEIATVYPKKTRSQKKSEVTEQRSEPNVTVEDDKKPNNRSFVTSFSMDYFEKESTPPEPPKIVSPPKVVEKTPEPPPKPFNIMDHVSTIKVNGVGILFQCKLCNRNFLKKDGVESHGCAKNNVPKYISQNNMPIPEPPRPPTVKYITMDKDFKKNMVNDSRKVERPLEQKVPEKPSPEPVNQVIVKQEPVDPPKPKPKAGPASKMRKLAQNEPPPEPKPTAGNIPEFISRPTPPSIAAPTVNFPTNPSMFSSYKLVPGPNNSFTLLEDKSQKQIPEPEKIVPQQQVRKRKVVNVPRREMEESVIDLEDDNENPVPHSQANVQRPKPQPYPVGLFQAMPHNSNVYPTQLTAAPFVQAPFPQGYTQAVFQPNNQLQYGGIQVYNNNAPSVLPHAQSVLPHSQPGQTILLHQQSAQPLYSHPQSAQTVLPHPQPAQSVLPHPQSVQPIVPHPQCNQLAPTAPPTFTTPAMKKQSYTVVQTGHPSKLLISAKPQPVPEDLNKRRSNRKQLLEEKNKQNFQFVNVEPGARISYESTIQESQISTSSVGDSKTYTCNMCNEKFSREKKLLAHIQSHYNAMDEEDEKRSTPAPKKRGRKS